MIASLVQTLAVPVILFCLYPIVGALWWIVGAIQFRFFYKHDHTEFTYLDPHEQPFITIMVPAHNEEVMIESTLTYLLEKINYENYEVLVLNDGSTDRTPEILERMQKRYHRLRYITIEANQGKAHAFNLGLGFARGSYILSNDADTVPEPDALHKYMAFFLSPEGANFGAVTANMDVQNRDRIIEKSQTVEFSSIVGVIKRGQMATLGSMYAYSGANTMYSKMALIDSGLFRQDRATEDISICWDQQFRGWRAVFAPSILFYMNVPSSLNMLYRQRYRWAKGGTEVWLSNAEYVLKHPFRQFHRLLMFIDQTITILWCFFYTISLVIWLVLLAWTGATMDWLDVEYLLDLAVIVISFEMLIGLTQLIAALILDSHAAKLRYLIFAPLYLLFYWQMNVVTILTSFWPAVQTIRGRGHGTWKSPERQALGTSGGSQARDSN